MTTIPPAPANPVRRIEGRLGGVSMPKRNRRCSVHRKGTAGIHNTTELARCVLLLGAFLVVLAFGCDGRSGSAPRSSPSPGESAEAEVKRPAPTDRTTGEMVEFCGQTTLRRPPRCCVRRAVFAI